MNERDRLAERIGDIAKRHWNTQPQIAIADFILKARPYRPTDLTERFEYGQADAIDQWTNNMLGGTNDS